MKEKLETYFQLTKWGFGILVIKKYKINKH